MKASRERLVRLLCALVGVVLLLAVDASAESELEKAIRQQVPT